MEKGGRTRPALVPVPEEDHRQSAATFRHHLRLPQECVRISKMGEASAWKDWD